MRLSSACFPKKLTHCAHAERGAWRWFYILLYTTAEIEFNTAEIYRNTHFDEEKWRHALFPYLLKRGMKPDKPIKSPVWQTDEERNFTGRNSVPAHRKY
jgi:hypothetical protein